MCKSCPKLKIILLELSNNEIFHPEVPSQIRMTITRTGSLIEQMVDALFGPPNWNYDKNGGEIVLQSETYHQISLKT